MTPKYSIIFIFLLLISYVFSVELCSDCKLLVKALNSSIHDTMSKSFTGGDAEYEKKKLVSYEISETRLLEILDSITETSSTAVKNVLSRVEEKIEDWWATVFSKSPKEFSLSLLENKICFDDFCCPPGMFGKNCQPCAKCNSVGGNCSGNGTRTGNGSCQCKSGYFGSECNQCQEVGYFKKSLADDQETVCEKCPISCRTCNGPLETNCTECMPGYSFDEETKTCLDIDECKEETHCEDDGVFCENKPGSFRCSQCHVSCTKCTGGKESDCLECNTGFELKDSTCTDIDECELHKDLCSQENEECRNMPGSYECTCKDGFIKNDSGSCIIKDSKKEEL